MLRPNRQFPSCGYVQRKFKDDAGDKPCPIKYVPTQRYDRKEIQKRLDMMDNQLKELYDGDEVSSYNF